MCQFMSEKSQGTFLQAVWSFGRVWKSRIKEKKASFFLS